MDCSVPLRNPPPHLHFPSSSQSAGGTIVPKTVKVLRWERQSTCWLHCTGDCVSLTSHKWKKKKQNRTQGFLFPPHTVWPLTCIKPGLADNTHHLLVMWKHIHIQLSRMYNAAQAGFMVLWFIGPCICLHAWGAGLRQSEKYDITASGGDGWLISRAMSTYLTVMNQCTQRVDKSTVNVKLIAGCYGSMSFKRKRWTMPTS